MGEFSNSPNRMKPDHDEEKMSVSFQSYSLCPKLVSTSVQYVCLKMIWTFARFCFGIVFACFPVYFPPIYYHPSINIYMFMRERV